MKKIYIAGPYSDPNPIKFLDNIRNGMRAGTRLLLAGYAPFCPWLDFQFQFMLKSGEEMNVQLYHDYSIEWLKVADAVYLLPGWKESKGVTKELIIANKYYIPTFTSLQNLNKHVGNKI